MAESSSCCATKFAHHPCRSEGILGLERAVDGGLVAQLETVVALFHHGGAYSLNGHWPVID